MKTYIIPSLKLTVVLIIICSALYPLFIAGIGKLTPGSGDGVKITTHGLTVGYENIGQKFTDDKYFSGRPSAANYNAAGSAGSNKGASNAEYLAVVEARIDTFLIHNPGIKKELIPADLVTASGSGLDPDISLEAAKIQVPRIAKMRGISEQYLYNLIEKTKKSSLLGFLGPEKVNVLKLNIALNN